MYSKLLHTLDQAVTTDPLSVGEAVLDKSYMAQHHRGATGGLMLVQVVQLEQPRLPGLWQEESGCSRKQVSTGSREQYLVLNKAWSSSSFSMDFILYGLMTKCLQSLLSSRSVSFTIFCHLVISSQCLPLLGRTLFFCGFIGLSTLNCFSNACLSNFILSILFT